MPNEPYNEFHNLKVTTYVKLRKWRLDTVDNSKWCLYVFDESTQMWTPTTSLDRTGEDASMDPVEELLE